MMQQTFDQSGSSSAESPEMKQGGPVAAVIMRSVLKATSRFFFRGLIFPFIEPARLVEVVVGSSSSPSVHAGMLPPGWRVLSLLHRRTYLATIFVERFFLEPTMEHGADSNGGTFRKRPSSQRNRRISQEESQPI